MRSKGIDVIGWREIAVTLWVASLLMVAGRDVHAQDVQEPGLRLGAVRLAPSISASNIGIDSNVFNDADNPRQDFVTDLQGGLRIQVPIARSRLSGRTSLSYHYFHEFASQRSLNTANAARWEVPLNRLLPNVSYSYSNTRERPNQEIDARVHQQLSELNAGTTIRIAPRSSLGAAFIRTRTVYGDDAAFLGQELRDNLNRTTEEVALSFTHQLTALTRIGTTADVTRDLFDFSPEREANEFSIRPNVQFAPTALIRGTAEVGYRMFNPVSETVPDFNGIVAGVDLAYTFRSSTRFGVQTARDVNFSITDLQPYYVQTTLGFSFGQRFSDEWDVTVSVRRDWLDYRRDVVVVRPPGGSSPVLQPTTSRLFSTDAGIGYRLGRNVTIGAGIAYTQREGGLRNQYQGLRVTSAFTYAL